MAGLRWTITTSEIGFGGGIPKTGLQIITPSSHHGITVLGYGVSFDAVSVEAQPVEIALRLQTSIGTMTGFSISKEPCFRETVQSSAGVNASAEPVDGTLLDGIHVHPQQGYRYVWPMGRELRLPGGEKAGIVVTAPGSVNGKCWFWGEE